MRLIMNLIRRVLGHYEPLETPNLIMIVSLIIRCIMRLLAFQCIGGHRRCSTVQRVWVGRVRPRRKPGCTLTSHISWHRRCSTVWPGFFDRVHPGRKLGCALCLCGLVLGRPELQPVRSVNDRHKEWTTVVVTLRAVHS